jgi:hypothetical protein
VGGKIMAGRMREASQTSRCLGKRPDEEMTDERRLVEHGYLSKTPWYSYFSWPRCKDAAVVSQEGREQLKVYSILRLCSSSELLCSLPGAGHWSLKYVFHTLYFNTSPDVETVSDEAGESLRGSSCSAAVVP